MINLIPNQQKKKMVRDFYHRLVILVCVMLCVALIIAAVALIPAYMLSHSKSKLAQERLATEERVSGPVLSDEATRVVHGVNTELGIIEAAQANKFIVSEKVVDAILEKKISGIRITEISYENTTQDGNKVGISGTAPSREVLLLFRQALEESSYFKDVDLPISNFIKGSNIQFYLHLTPA